MKVRLEGASSIAVLRCPLDDKVLMYYSEDDVTIESCEHYHWHASSDDLDENKEDEVKEDENEEVEESWNEVLKQNYIAKVSVGDAAFYLIRLEKAVGK